MANSFQTVTATFTTGATSSTLIDIRGQSHVFVDLPTFASYMSLTSAIVYPKIANTTTTGSFKRVNFLNQQSSTVGVVEYAIPTGEGAKTVDISKVCGHKYLMLEFSAVTTGVVALNVDLGS